MLEQSASWSGSRVGGALAAAVLLLTHGAVRADPPIWANAKVVRATHTDCGSVRSLTLAGSSSGVPRSPVAAGCTSWDKTYRQVFVARAFLGPERKGAIAESNVDAGTIQCSNGDALVILGRAGDVERALRQRPTPAGCTATTGRYQQVSSVGSIPFTDVANGGTMSVKESLALHAKERERAIAECNASAACRAEVSRINRERAIAEYDECMKPAPQARVCTRPR